MVSFRLYCLLLQILTLSHTSHSLVMLTANSKDVKNIARKFLTESLSNKIAEFIAKSSNKIAENIIQDNNNNNDNNLNESQGNKDDTPLEEISDVENIQTKDTIEEEKSKYQYRNRAIESKGKKPSRSTHKWLEPIETNPEFQKYKHNYTESGDDQHVIKISSLNNAKYNKNYIKKSKYEYQSGKLKDLDQDVPKADLHYHKPNMKLIKTKLEPIPEVSPENVHSDGDTIETKTNVNTHDNDNYFHKDISNEKAKMNGKTNAVKLPYISEPRPNKNKIVPVSFIDEYLEEKNSKNQIPDETTNLTRQPKLRQPNLKYKKRYQSLKESLRNKKIKKTISKPTRYLKKEFASEEYYKKQQEKNIKNPNWSEEPEPLENKKPYQTKKSKKAYIRDQLKLRHYPKHNFYYSMKLKNAPHITANEKESPKTDITNYDEIRNQHEFDKTKTSYHKDSFSTKKAYAKSKVTINTEKVRKNKKLYHPSNAKLTDSEEIRPTFAESKESQHKEVTRKDNITNDDSKYAKTESKIDIYDKNMNRSNNKEIARTEHTIATHSLTTKSERNSDENISIGKQTTSRPTDSSAERRLTTAKAGNIMGTRSTVYHGRIKKDMSSEKRGIIHYQKEYVTQNDKAHFHHGIRKGNKTWHTEDSVYHKQEMASNSIEVEYHTVKNEEDDTSHDVEDTTNHETESKNKKEIEAHSQNKKLSKETISQEEIVSKSHTDEPKNLLATSGDFKLTAASNDKENIEFWKRIEKEIYEVPESRPFRVF